MRIILVLRVQNCGCRPGKDRRREPKSTLLAAREFQQIDDKRACHLGNIKRTTGFDIGYRWRHSGAMKNQTPSTVVDLSRINLRLSGETFQAIDSARNSRPGRVSRNTWIAEAIDEKLARESAVDSRRYGNANHA